MASGSGLRLSLGKRKFVGDAEDEEHKPDINSLNAVRSDDEDDDDDDDSDDSDEDDDEEAGEGITGKCEYDENTEPLPDCPAFDPNFAQVTTDLKALARDIGDVIGRTECDSDRVKNFRNMAMKLTQISSEKRNKICLLGNTGAGKSSLLNSLLGHPNLARALASGESCTWVGTEYESPFLGQMKMLAAKVEYFDTEAVTALLTRLVKDYNIWSFERQDDWNDDDQQEFSRLSTSAFNTFRTLFCDKIEFESPGAGEDFLEWSYNEGNHLAFNTFQSWCEELLIYKSADEGDHAEYFEADTQGELLEQLNPLVSSSARYEQPSLWPLVKKVRIGIYGVEILEHATLVDLPGIDDTNKGRVKTSEQILNTCDWIWLVTKIDRAITETTVDSLLMRYGKSFKMAVICTGIDDNIDPALAAYLANEGQSIGDHDALLEREKELRKDVKRLNKKIERGTAKLDGYANTRGKKGRKSSPDKTTAKLNGQIADYVKLVKGEEDNLRSIEQERFELLVDARNANMIRRLQEEKRKYVMKGHKLQVFCVSNSDYAALKGARVISGPRLNPKATGIPGLRSFIRQRAAPSILRTVEHYINYDFARTIERLDAWSSGHAVAGGRGLLEEIKSTQTQIQSILRDFVHELLLGNQKINIQPLQNLDPDQVEHAVEVMGTKKKYSWNTVRAFIRRDGNHQTSIVPQECWNEQFLDKANKIMDETWPLFIEYWKELHDQMTHKMKDLVKDIERTVADHAAIMMEPTDRMEEIFKAQQYGINQACEEYSDSLKKDLRNIKLDASQDRHSGYFSLAMAEAYEQCKSESGPGIKGRICSILEVHLLLKGERSPFSVNRNNLSAAIERTANSQSKRLVERVEGILEDIRHQLEDLVDHKIDDLREYEAMERLKESLGPAKLKYGDIKCELKRIKRKYGVD